MPSKYSISLAICLTVASCVWAERASARSSKAKVDRDYRPGILCLRPGGIDRLPQDKLDKTSLDCLLQASGMGEEGVWQRQLRECLAAKGVLEGVGCHYGN